MPQAIRYTLLSLRDLSLLVGPFVLLALILVALAYVWLDPNPPKHVTLATGPAQSAYAEFGKQYASALAKNGITVELVSTEGSAANLRLLREGKVDLGFVQGGSGAAPAEAEDGKGQGLESLGSLFLEPVWLFYRGPTLATLTQLKGKRVNVGTPDSGLPHLMDKLLEVNRIDRSTLHLSNLEQTPATVALLAGELDAVVLASAPESLMVQMLLQTPGIRLMNFPQSEAYSRRFSFLSSATLPQGVVDLAANIPAQDVHLVAPTTSLLGRSSTHPALVQLFALAANDIHSDAGWFTHAREYPSLHNNELPIAQEAERAIRSGGSLLQRYLPFWVANMVERMWLAMGIILAILLPLSRVVPPLYQFRIRSRIFRWYAQLRAIEHRFAQQGDTAQLIEELQALDRSAQKIRVPLSYADELYALRSNIALVHQKLIASA